MQDDLKVARLGLVEALKRLVLRVEEMRERETWLSADMVREYLDEHEWCYKESDIDEFEVFDGYWQGERLEQPVFCVKIIVWHATVMLHAYAPLRIPEDRMGAIAEYVSRVNKDQVFNAFIVDFENRLVYLRGAVDLEDMNGSPAKEFSNLVDNVLETLDEHIHQIVAVISGKSAKEAYCCDKDADGD